VLVVASDGFFDEEAVRGIVFTHAKFIQDHFHLYDSGLKKMFGTTRYKLLQLHLIIIVQAKSKEEFDGLVDAAELVLKSQKSRNGQLEGDFAKHVPRKQFYATYCLRLIPGNWNRKGSTIAEVNHLSVLSSLNGD